MKITLEEVRRIARLAHIQGPGASLEEMERMRGQLDQILVYIDKIGELDTDGVEPAIGLAAGAPRDDTPRVTLSGEEALSNAPESGRGHFKVPRVIA